MGLILVVLHTRLVPAFVLFYNLCRPHFIRYKIWVLLVRNHSKSWEQCVFGLRVVHWIMLESWLRVVISLSQHWFSSHTWRLLGAFLIGHLKRLSGIVFVNNLEDHLWLIPDPTETSLFVVNLWESRWSELRLRAWTRIIFLASFSKVRLFDSNVCIHHFQSRILRYFLLRWRQRKLWFYFVQECQSLFRRFF